MNIKIRNSIFILVGVLTAALTLPNTGLAKEVTIVGEVNEQYGLVSSENGTIYRIARGEVGDKLVNQHRGDKVRVVGKLIVDVQDSAVDELPTGLIEVISFEDLAE